MRLPVSELRDSFLAKSARTIRVSLGPMTVRKAEILAQQLATLCRITVGMARYLGLPMTNEDLFDDVVKACATGIQEIRKHPENAMALARGLDAVHASLTPVAEEMAKGPAGMTTIVGNASALVQEGLSRVLALSGAAIDPGAIDAESLLATIGKATSLLPLPAAPPPQAVVAGCPTFGEVSGRCIELRRAMGASKGEVDTLLLRRKTFLDVIGDRPVDDYSPSDLQRYVIRMQHWPVDANKRIEQGVDWDTKDILDQNSGLNQRPMALKTMHDGYVANIKTMMRFEMVDRNYRDPFSGARIRWPSGYVPSKPREGLDEAVLNRVFELGCALMLFRRGSLHDAGTREDTGRALACLDGLLDVALGAGLCHRRGHHCLEPRRRDCQNSVRIANDHIAGVNHRAISEGYRLAKTCHATAIPLILRVGTCGIDWESKSANTGSIAMKTIEDRARCT